MDEGTNGGASAAHDKVLEQVIHLITNMLQNTHAPVQYYKPQLVDLGNSFTEEKQQYNHNLQQIITNQLLPVLNGLTIHHKNNTDTLPELTLERMEGLKLWDFDPFPCTELELLSCLRYMFEYFNLLEKFNIPRRTMDLFLLSMRDHYHTNIYHNLLHGFDVSQTAFYLLVTEGVSKYLTDVEIFVIIISCMCHDIGHPGLNNAYMVKSESDLALLYNNRSVLENHHCHTTFKLLQIPELNILANIPIEDRTNVKQLIIDSILGTDMGVHYSQHMRNLVTRLKNPHPLSRDSDEDRKLLTEVLVHLCDLGNLARPFTLSKSWCERVTDENFQQGMLEQSHGWPLNTRMDPNRTSCALNMANFIDEIVTEFFTVFERLVPESHNFVEMLLENRKKWDVLIKKEQHKQQTNNSEELMKEKLIVKQNGPENDKTECAQGEC